MRKLQQLKNKLKENNRLGPIIIVGFVSIMLLGVILLNISKQLNGVQLEENYFLSILLYASYIYLSLMMIGTSVIALYALFTKKYTKVLDYINDAAYFLILPTLVTLPISFLFGKLSIIIFTLLFFMNIASVITEQLFKTRNKK